MPPPMIWTTLCLLSISFWRVNGGELTKQNCPTEKNSSAHEDLDSGEASCDFDNDTCGWTNPKSPAYPLTWCISPKGGYAYVNMNHFGRGRNRKGRLESPWLHPQCGYECQLQFSYAIQGCRKCRLSVLRETADHEQEIWNSMDSSSLNLSQHVGIDCETEQFRIIFEVKRRCLLPRCINLLFERKIKLDGIELRATPLDSHSSGSDAFCKPDKDTKPGRLDPFILAGIIIAAIVVLMTVAIVITIACRRRTENNCQTDHILFKIFQRKSSPSSASSRVPRAYVNVSYEADDDEQAPVLGGPSANRDGHSNSHHMYHTIDDNGDTLAEPLIAPHSACTSNQDHNYPNHYNQLTLKGTKVAPSVPTAGSDYDHTQAKYAATYPAARTRGFQIEDDDGRLVTHPSAPSHDVYNRLDARGGLEVGRHVYQDYYHHFNDLHDTGIVFNSLETEGGLARRSGGQEIHQGHCDHLNDHAGTGIEYNSMGQEDHKKDRERRMAANEYTNI